MCYITRSQDQQINGWAAQNTDPRGLRISGSEVSPLWRCACTPARAKIPLNPSILTLPKATRSVRRCALGQFYQPKPDSVVSRVILIVADAFGILAPVVGLGVNVYHLVGTKADRI
jgi:hypothetical protein